MTFIGFLSKSNILMPLAFVTFASLLSAMSLSCGKVKSFLGVYIGSFKSLRNMFLFAWLSWSRVRANTAASKLSAILS